MLVTRAELRRLLLVQQGLWGERAPGGVAGALAWVRGQGFIPLETKAHALMPGHDLILFSRLAGYQAGDLDGAVYGQGQLFEHYLHLLGALPAADYALVHDQARAREASQPGGTGCLIIECLRSSGPATLRDLQAHLPNAADGGQRAVATAVQRLLACGAILVRQREGGQILYDVAARVVPGGGRGSLAREDRLRALAQRTLRLLAPVTRTTWSQVLNGVGLRARLDLPELKRAKGRLMDDLLARGEAVLVQVEDSPQGYIVPADWLPLLQRRPAPPAGRLALLSPLDPTVWDRQRALDLFGFDGREQAYRAVVTGRRAGGLALPILYGQDLVGRVELQMNWANDCLLVRAAHLEEPARLEDSRLRAALSSALSELATWHGARDVRAAGPVPPRLLP